MAGESAPRCIDDRTRKDQGQFWKTTLLEETHVCEDGGPCVQRVKNSLNENDVTSAGDEPSDLLLVSIDQLHVGHIAEGGIFDFGGDAGRAVRRTDSSRNEAPARFTKLVSLLGHSIGCAPRQDRGLLVDFKRPGFEPVIALRDALPIESVCFNDVGAGAQVLLVNLRDQVGFRDVKQVVVVLDKLLHGFELLT